MSRGLSPEHLHILDQIRTGRRQLLWFKYKGKYRYHWEEGGTVAPYLVDDLRRRRRVSLVPRPKEPREGKVEAR